MRPSTRLLVLAFAVLSAAPGHAAEMFGDDYKPCGDQENTMAVVECIDGRIKAWDRRLNAAYGAVQRVIEPGQREPLRTAQRLWIQYRNANCGFYGAQEGTIRQIQAAECVRAMTRDRALELEQIAKP